MLTIKPEDFSTSTADPNYRNWTLGKLEHLVAVLIERDAEVLVETDRMTGHTERVKIIGLLPQTPTQGARLRLFHKAESGDQWVTTTRIATVGVIVELDDLGARSKWDALKLKSEAESKALDLVRAYLVEKGRILHDSQPYRPGTFYGKWTMRGDGFGTYSVSYEPQREDAAPWHAWTVNISSGHIRPV